MARIDHLIDKVTDDDLRRELVKAAAELRRRKKFGLVFEEHVPETVLLGGQYGVRNGAEVLVRTNPDTNSRWWVTKTTKTKATITDGIATQQVAKDDLLVVVPFGEPVYPVLRPADAPVVRTAAKSFHCVIEGENFHALQLLAFSYEGAVDCIYCDPPYNTGDPNWTYNNKFIDDKDDFRHSKWLSMMEKRLRLAKRLLKPDGVLVVTIDEHEVGNLLVLLAEKDLFGDARRQMVTIVNNGAGVTQGGFSRVEEYAIFCFLGDARPQPVADDLLLDESKAAKTPVWFSLVRYGGVDAPPSKRPNMVYPVAIDPTTNRIVATGRSLKEMVDAGEVTGDLDAWHPPASMTIDGNPVIWPFRGDGTLSRWQVNPPGLRKLAADGFIRARPTSEGTGGNQFTLSYIKSGNQKKILSGEISTEGREPDGGPYVVGGIDRVGVPKTVWKRARHDAGKWGSRTLRELLGSVSFDYAKSPYAVLDTLRTLVGNKPDALVLDFFAGSGTTLHSVAMLNAEDGGRRRCILVTNNQVPGPAAKLLNDEGHFAGDPAFEAKGICHAVTIPRVKAALTGERSGKPIPGKYWTGREIADGFEENAAFFSMAYEDPDRIQVGDRFPDILPALWLAAGAVGDPSVMKADDEWFMDPAASFAVLFDEDRLKDFLVELRKRPDVTHVWLVTDSASAFARMRTRVPGNRPVGMLYRDYLSTFRVNTDTRGEHL